MGCAPAHPSAFFTPCRLVFKNPEPVIKMFANGGGCGPPKPPAFFCAMQAVFQEKRTINTNFSTRSCYVVFNILSNHTRCLFANEVLRSRQHPASFLSCARSLQLSSWQQRQNPYGPPQNWGAAPPQPPCRLTSSIFAPAKTEPIWTFSEPVKGVCKWGGPAPPPPNPLVFFLRHAVWFSKTQNP